MAMADTYQREQDYESAARTLKRAEALAKEKRAEDYEITICQKLADC